MVIKITCTLCECDGDEEMDVGRSRISFFRRALGLGCRQAKGKTFSSKTTSQEMYMRPVDTSRHLTFL
jgi:hypothetical protein